jgi:hypothetical protein
MHCKGFTSYSLVGSAMLAPTHSLLLVIFPRLRKGFPNNRGSSAGIRKHMSKETSHKAQGSLAPAARPGGERERPLLTPD